MVTLCAWMLSALVRIQPRLLGIAMYLPGDVVNNGLAGWQVQLGLDGRWTFYAPNGGPVACDRVPGVVRENFRWSVPAASINEHPSPTPLPQIQERSHYRGGAVCHGGHWL